VNFLHQFTRALAARKRTFTGNALLGASRTLIHPSPVSPALSTRIYLNATMRSIATAPLQRTNRCRTGTRPNFRIARHSEAGRVHAISDIHLEADRSLFAAFSRMVNGGTCSGLTKRFTRKRLPSFVTS
jgi:hypothetical protein